jgi:hypothetical protein
MEKLYHDAELLPSSKGAEEVVLTRQEVDFLDKYSRQVRKWHIKQVIEEVRAMLDKRYQIEDTWASMCKDADERGQFLYGRKLCEKLMIELGEIERRYNDETD